MSKPTVAVIGGTGAEGSGLAVRWAVAGYPVVIGSRSSEKAASVSAELAGLLPAGSAAITGATNAAAAAAGDAVVLSVPYDAQAATIDQIAAACQGKVLITVGVPPAAQGERRLASAGRFGCRGGAGPTGSGGARGRRLSEHRRHLKNLDWQADCDVLIAGDDKEAKQLTGSWFVPPGSLA